MTKYTTPAGIPATWLVADREIRMRLRSKAFLISTGILMLVVLASIVVGGIVGANPSKTSVAAVGDAVAVARGIPSFDVTEANSTQAAEKLVREEKVDAALLPAPQADSGVTNGQDPVVKIVALDSAPTAVIGALSTAPEVQLLEPADQNKGIIYLVALAFGLIFFTSAITFGSTIAQSVVEEKQTRIVEILMSTVPVRVLLAGKIVGNSILAFGQIIAIGIIAGVGLLATGQDILLADVGPSIVWFIVFFAFGFVMLAALYSAAAALVSRQEDVGSVTSPVMMLVMIPYFLVIFFYDNPTVLAIMSYVPFSAPVGMPIRVFLGTAQWWEPLLSLAILIATTALVMVIGSRVYANGLLRTGARVKLKDALAR